MTQKTTGEWVIEQGSHSQSKIVSSRRKATYSVKPNTRQATKRNSTGSHGDRDDTNGPRRPPEKETGVTNPSQHNSQEVTENWRLMVSCLFFAVVGFVIGLTGIAGHTVSPHQVWLYIIGGGGVVYVLLRCGVAYFIHKDAKMIRQHTQARMASNEVVAEHSWSPRAVMWGVCAVSVPPGGDIGLVIGYLYRRHQHIGSP